MYVHRESGRAFLAHPRTASRACAHFLKQKGFQRVGPHHSYVVGDYMGNVACVVRNHFDTLASWHRHMSHRGRGRKTPMPPRVITPEWIEGHLNAHGHYFALKENLLFPGALIADFIIRYKELEDGLRRWLQQPVRLPVIGSRKIDPPPHRESFTPEAREYVEHRFADEMYRLLFSWDPGPMPGPRKNLPTK